MSARTERHAGRQQRNGPAPLGPAIAFLRRLRHGLDGGSGLAQALSEATLSLPRDAREGLEAARRRLGGDYPEGEWGFDEEFADVAYPFLEFMY